MAHLPEQVLGADSAFCSSLSADVWHAQSGEKAFETWYFDALSDDGREALAITFTDNYVFSPRYAEMQANDGAVVRPEPEADPKRFPAVTFIYSVDGKPVFRSINEFTARQFHAVSGEPGCSIGDSSFRVDTAAYGAGYWLTVDVPYGPSGRLRANLEWLTVDADFIPDDPTDTPRSSWNMVAARSDVSGRIEVLDHNGTSTKLVQFRGTGYHDHIRGSEALQDFVSCRQWGRAHFTDCTAVFCSEIGSARVAADTKLVIVCDGDITVRAATPEQRQMRRDRYGIKYPTRMSLLADNGIRLRIKPFDTIESSFYNVRFLSEMTLTLRDGKPRKTVGISEIVSPKNLKYRLFRWFSDLRIAKHGKRP